MKVTLIPVVIGALGTLTKGLVQELEDLEIKGRVKTIQTTALLRSVWEEFWRLEVTCCLSDSKRRREKLTRAYNNNKGEISHEKT